MVETPETPSGGDPGRPGPARQGLVARLASELRDGPEQRRYVTLALAALLVLYVIGLLIANSKKVSISFVLGSASISLIWLIILCVGMGMAIGWILRGRRDRARAGR